MSGVSCMYTFEIVGHCRRIVLFAAHNPIDQFHAHCIVVSHVCFFFEDKISLCVITLCDLCFFVFLSYS